MATVVRPTPEPEPTTPPGGEPESVARHIARAAARLFATRGYDATSVREIVEAAGVTKPTLYYHFGSKAGLAQALVTDPMNRLTTEMRTRLDAAGDPVSGLADMLQTKLDFCCEDPDRARFFYALFFGPLATGLAAEVARFGAAMDAVQDAAIERLASHGVVPVDRIEFFRDALNGLCVVHTVDYLYRDRPIAPDLARRLVAGLLGGCRAAATPGPDEPADDPGALSRSRSPGRKGRGR